MQTYHLSPHPDHPPAGVGDFSVSMSWRDGWLRLRYRLQSEGGLQLPYFAGRGRADGLWQATCFELFARQPSGSRYCEFNFAPSEQWAAYDFTDYREGMTDRAMPRDPVSAICHGGRTFLFDVALRREALPPLPARAALSAVIVETDGTKSFWALAHPAAKPDFHHPDCFTAQLPPPDAP